MEENSPPDPEEQFGTVVTRFKKQYEEITQLCKNLEGKNTKTFSQDKNTRIQKANEFSYVLIDSLFKELCRTNIALKKTKQQLKEANEAKAQASAQFSQVANVNKPYAEAAAQAVSNNDNQNKQLPNPKCTVRVITKLDPTGVKACATAEATKKLLNTIDLSQTTIGVKGIWKSGGGVSVCCRSQEEATKLVDIISDQVGSHVTASKPVLRNPTFTMLLSTDKYVDKSTYERLENEIIARNPQIVINQGTDLEIVHSLKTRNHNSLVFMKVSPEVYRTIINCMRSKIYVGWELVKLREQCPISQCYDCHKFGHKSNSCIYEVDGQHAKRCSRCGGSHEASGCNAPLCCSNCSDANKYVKGRVKHETNHSSTDLNCPMRLNAIRKAKMYINYDRSEPWRPLSHPN